MNIYDFDKTIYDGDSSVDFFFYSLMRNKKILFDIIPISFSIFLYLIKVFKKEQMKSSFFRFLRRISVQEYVEDFWKKNDCKMKDFYIKQKKPSDIIVSATPEFLLKPVAKKYGFNLVATDVDINTGKLLGKNCYGDQKVVRLNELKITFCENFYSDSLSDTPCANIARSAFIVQGDKIINWEEYGK